MAPAIEKTELASMDRQAAKMAGYYVGKYPRWTERDEIKQHAMCTMVHARDSFHRNYDPSKGTKLGAYLFKATNFALTDFVWKSISPATIPYHKRAECFEHVRMGMSPSVRARLETRAGRHRDLSWSTQPIPSEELEASQRKRAVLSAMERAFSKIANEHLAREVLLSDTKPAKVAQKYDIPVRKVYQAVRDACRQLGKSKTLFRLWKDED